MRGSAPLPGMGTASPARALGDRETLRRHPAPSLPGCGRPPLPLREKLPAQPGKLRAQVGAKFAPVLQPPLSEKAEVAKGEGLPLVPLHARRMAPPPQSRPGRSPTISPTDLPASSPPRCSTPFSRAAALRRTPLSLGDTLPPQKKDPPGVRRNEGDGG